MQETIRAFLAIRVADDAKRAIRDVVERLRTKVSEARFVPPDQWHLTLHFFAALSPVEVQAVREVARNAVAELRPFTIGLGGLGTFPDPRRPRVLWLGLREGADECTVLHRRIATGLRARGLPAEDRPFRPHVTLARFRDARPGGVEAALRSASSHDLTRFTADRVLLFQSTLTSRGAEHRVLDAFVLGGQALDGERECGG